MVTELPPFRPEQLEAIAKVLGETGSGLTGTEIGRTLQQCGISDPFPSYTKWKRLDGALSEHQEKTASPVEVIHFIENAMSPVRYVDDHSLFEERRQSLNRVLVMCGLELNDRGEFVQHDPAKTVPEARRRAASLRAELERRAVHYEVLRFCREEWDGEDYFHAVLEATKSVAERIRDVSELDEDGCDLVNSAFGGARDGSSVLRFNELSTPTEISEHNGLMSLMKGMFQAFRNPTAHDPRIMRDVTEVEALALLSLASYIHRRLDDVKRNAD